MPVRFPSVIYRSVSSLCWAPVILWSRFATLMGPDKRALCGLSPAEQLKWGCPSDEPQAKLTGSRCRECEGFLVFAFQKVLGHIAEKLELEWTSEVMYSSLPHKAKKKKSRLFSDSHPAFVGTQRNKYIHLSPNKQFWVRQTFGGHTRRKGVEKNG